MIPWGDDSEQFLHKESKRQAKLWSESKFSTKCYAASYHHFVVENFKIAHSSLVYFLNFPNAAAIAPFKGITGGADLAR